MILWVWEKNKKQQNKTKSKTQLLTSILQFNATHENIYITIKASPVSPKLIRFFCFTGFRQEVSQTQIMLFYSQSNQHCTLKKPKLKIYVVLFCQIKLWSLSFKILQTTWWLHLKKKKSSRPAPSHRLKQQKNKKPGENWFEITSI